MIIITILLLLAPGLLAIKIAGQMKVNTWKDTVNVLATWIINNLLIVIFTNVLIYLTKGAIQINLTTVYMEQNVYNSIYYNTFIIRYGIFAVIGAVILGIIERGLVGFLRKKGYLNKK